MNVRYIEYARVPTTDEHVGVMQIKDIESGINLQSFEDQDKFPVPNMLHTIGINLHVYFNSLSIHI